jgi:hypothetical protein
MSGVKRLDTFASGPLPLLTQVPLTDSQTLQPAVIPAKVFVRGIYARSLQTFSSDSILLVGIPGNGSLFIGSSLGLSCLSLNTQDWVYLPTGGFYTQTQVSPVVTAVTAVSSGQLGLKFEYSGYDDV